MATTAETDLYPPIKRFLEAQGYEVKGEVGDCDLMARRTGEDPVIVELKTRFNLALVLQGIRRQALTDQVYLAFAAPTGGNGTSTWRRYHRDIKKLCRMLGLGLIAVRGDLSTDRAVVEVHLDPGPYRPQKNKRRRSRLLREFQHRVGDPNPGGAAKRRPLITAYRQDALRCAALLGRDGATKIAAIRVETGVARAAGILQRDVYGWFERSARGVYELSPAGQAALETYADVIATLTETDPIPAMPKEQAS
jgi:hypothetical protein